MKKLIIIGGGAAGLTAAVTAGRILKSGVTVLERKDVPGKKILATGNGRCNFSNINTSAEHYRGESPDLVDRVLKQVGVSETLEFFESIGLHYRLEEGERYYPYSSSAKSLMECFRNQLELLDVEIVTGYEVKQLELHKDKEFWIDGQRSARRVIVAAGGAAQPSLGSNGSGFNLLEQMKHRITGIHPALVQLKTAEGYLKHLQGLRFDVGLSFLSEGKVLAQDRGELLFTSYGISGIVVMQLSYLAGLYKNLTAVVDFMPDLTFQEALKFLEQRHRQLKNLPTRNFFDGLFHKNLGQVLIKLAKVKENRLSDDDLRCFARLIKNFSLTVTGTNGFENAQITFGGADTKEFDHTLESRKVKGLYAAGEVLDIAGDCGGYNLQWAWSSGIVAGKHAAESLAEE